MNQHPLRRADRAASRDEALETLDTAPFVVVSTTDADGEPYGVPLSFVRRGDALYFHTSSEGGHKTDCFRHDHRACATAVTGVRAFFEGGDFSTSYQSAMAFGRIREVTDPVEFKRALVDLCMKYVPEHKRDIGRAMEAEGPRTAVWALDIDELSGKRRPLPTSGREASASRTAGAVGAGAKENGATGAAETTDACANTADPSETTP
ncbi:pyridoxamine 5'-phosphate oxidase [Gordonibacter sp. An230]|uniref:pyridoxamine 5'-phosphate oxidase family protein n=1 Tax=Gordonibacter sp. An230 TaxID=1965592 RepID=UPI000B394595|nr:pyridoxamine 5'-phosphate oxidase family protein [Gordonibacter sp. An230]OUO86302.1 pyridoxamine 5'-phosphate oxidase [Gordonibacter sp. An230]